MAMDTKNYDSESDSRKKQKISNELEHAWNYFQIHANQRISLFRFYIVFFSIYVTGAGFLLVRFPYNRIFDELSAITISIAFIIITIMFQLLDLRNRQLIHYAERALRDIEKNFDNKIYRVFSKEFKDKIHGNSRTGHTTCFSIIFICSYLVAVIFIIFAIYSAYHC